MLSSVKNFFLTFILALAVFGLIATVAVRLVVNNINGTLERGDDTTAPADVDPDDPGHAGNNSLSGEKTLSFLIIGTDYRGNTFSDYDPEQLKTYYGIEKENVVPAPAPGDVVPYYVGGVSSDTYYTTESVVETGDGKIVFPNGFYTLSYRKIGADAVVLLRLDKSRRQITLTSFPTDAYIEAGGSYMTLSEVFSNYGVSELKDAVHMITGVRPDYYMSVDLDSFPRLIDAINGVEYYVPEQMTYTDYAGGINIDLKKGTQLLNGADALSMLMYRDYSDSSLSREKTCASFCKAVIAKVMTPEYYGQIGYLAGLLLDCVKTDVSGSTIIENVGFVRSFAGLITEISPVTESGTFRGSAVKMFNTEKSRARYGGLN